MQLANIIHYPAFNSQASRLFTLILSFKSIRFNRYLMFENDKMKLNINHFLLIVFFLLIDIQTKATSEDTHKFYVSQLNMDYNEQLKTFQLSFSIFINDLEMTLENKTDKKIKLDEITDVNESLVFEYVKDHFYIKTVEKILDLKNIGYEIEEDLIWVYIETTQTEIPQSLEIKNDVLFELFTEQKNMVKIKIGEHDYSALFTVKNPIENIKLDD